MSKAKRYYVLLVKRDGKWSQQFGDYDKEVVKDEIEFCYDTEPCKILACSDNQDQINAAIALLNEGK